MAKSVLVFFLLFAVFFFGINFFVKLSGSEKWELVKVLSYSVACTLLTAVVLFSIVVLF